MALNHRYRAFPMGLLVTLGLASCGVTKVAEQPDGAASSVVAACNDYCGSFPETCPDCAHLSPVMSACIIGCVLEVQECHSLNTPAQCMSYRCVDRGGEGPLDTGTPSCQDAWKLYLDCIVTQTVVCAPDSIYINQPGECETQATAVGAMCV